jgi:hypothetical protein
LSLRRNIFLLALLLLAGCGPTDPRIIAQCKAAATAQAKGHLVDISDIGELTEACMMKKGFVVRETGKGCSDDISGPLNPRCYYPDTIPGRIAAWAGLR